MWHLERVGHSYLPDNKNSAPGNGAEKWKCLLRYAVE